MPSEPIKEYILEILGGQNQTTFIEGLADANSKRDFDEKLGARMIVKGCILPLHSFSLTSVSTVQITHNLNGPRVSHACNACDTRGTRVSHAWYMRVTRRH